MCPGLAPSRSTSTGRVGTGRSLAFVYREHRYAGLPATVWTAQADRPDRVNHPGPPDQPGQANRIAAADSAHRVLPDASIDIIWSSDGRLIVAGPDTTATIARWAPGVQHVGVRFDPGHGPAYLGTDAELLRDGRVDLAELWGDGPARRFADRLAAAPPEAAARAGVMTAALAGREPDPRLSDPLAPAIVAGTREHRPVGDLARSIGLSERQLLRRSRRVFGYGPKTLARVLRLQDALRTARLGHGLAQVAAMAGYADQAHLAREVRALAGVTATELLTPTTDEPRKTH
ncbi:helix-turn-helix transcriptional regulator [Frankia sp. R82]|uniref:helix-turn-helix transcriptional regulator n=1 Tax=Frankia sp. R82 TaxID=2950553 RepID=UPI0020445B1B|nr:helix-turn-helix transcriptional regulator [Frankia sp. R82]MCM3885372.1 helix-turn-helix transcriptional regulator [Frankia sp. R82]